MAHNFKSSFGEDTLAKSAKVTSAHDLELRAGFRPLGVFEFDLKLQQTDFATQIRRYLRFVTVGWSTTQADLNLATQSTDAKEALLVSSDCTDVEGVANEDLNLLALSLALQL